MTPNPFPRRLSPFRKAYVLGMAAGIAGMGVAQDPDLDILRAELSRPGPEAQDVRHSAALALMDRPDPAAHGVLQGRLLDDQDPDDVRGMVLEQLESRLRNDRDKVFGLSVAAGADGIEARMALHRSYVGPLAHCMGPVSGQVPGEAPLLKGKARACYLRLDPQARFAGVEALLAGGDVARAILAARESRLPRAGKILAGMLGDASHGAAARAALGELTFHPPSFATEQAFDEWYSENQGLTYTDLAERAARGAKGALDDVRARFEQDLLLARANLARSLCRGSVIAWDDLRELCTASPRQSLACLAAVRPEMESRLHEGNGVRERRAFHLELVERLDGPVASDGELAATDAAALRANILEVSAYLLRPGDPAEVEIRDAMTARLRRAMGSPSHPMRLAALRGVRRFFSEENRGAVLAEIETELQRLDSLAAAEGPAAIDARGKAEQVLTAAFTALDNTTVLWPAPEGDDLSVLRSVLDTVLARPGIEGIKRQALGVARLRDAQGRRLNTLFECLEAQVRDLDSIRSPELRRLAFLYTQDYMSEKGLTDQYVRLALDLLEDGEPELRRVAAERLNALPEADSRLRNWSREVLMEVRELLLTEQEPSVYKELVKTLAQCARPPRAEPQDVENVLLALQGAIEDTTRDPVRLEVQFRLPSLFGELNVIAAGPDVSTDQWVLATDVLVRHGQRDRALDVLARQRPDQVLPTDPSSLTAWTLPLQAAELRAADQGMGVEEAQALRVLMGLLDEHEAGWRTPTFQLIEVEVACALGDMPKAREVGATLIQSPQLAAGLLDRARLAVAQAEAAGSLADRGPQKAVALLLEVAPGSGYSPRAAELLQQIATAHRGTDPALALAAAGAMRALLTEDQVGFRDRFLLWAEITLALEPSATAQVATELQRWKGLFTAADCPENTRAAFAALEGQVGGTPDPAATGTGAGGN